MRLASFLTANGPSYGIVREDGIVDLGARLGGDLRGILAEGLERPRELAEEPADLHLKGLRWLPLIPNPGAIYCVGLNYRAHVEEVGRPLGDWPTVFLRVPPSQTGHLAPIVRPRVSEQLDFEGELAAVIGRPGRHIEPATALEHIAGYSLYNDGSVRDWQRHSAQYTAGKNFAATGAFGPWLVTGEEAGDPSRLELTTRLNGEVVQHAPLSELIFTIPQIVAYISTFSQLEPGDVIVTGTPAGVGAGREPKLWLRAGDTIEVEVPGIGTLRNPIVDE
ncbi:MAG TPA: fumarylacetoacetate hydrolase family protein [Solirubrobacteraceae bacterium]|nr:fumarylacetoacetate hydrolase family protein [Solirubrobacteraceae bacterium]